MALYLTMGLKKRTAVSNINFSNKIKMVLLEDLEPYSQNAKTHSAKQIDKIIISIQKFGFTNPILVSKSMGILAGHCRRLAAQKMGLEKVPVIFLDYLTDSEQRQYIIADNKLAEFGTDWNEEILFEEIQRIQEDDRDFDLTDLGFVNEEVEKLLDEFGNSEDRKLEEENQDVIPSVENSICRKGDLWQLGNHRLLCGDSTKEKDVFRLLDGNLVDMVLTDPPYGVNYSAKNDFLNKVDKGNCNQREIQNDNIEDYEEFFFKFLSIIPMADYNTCFIAMFGQELHRLRIAFEHAGFYWSDYLVWVKNNHVLARKDFNAKHEFFLYGWKGRHKFYGSPSSTTILEYDRPLKSDLHPTMKPVALMERLIEDGSKRNFIIYDSFGGSGSTLIACEKTHRRCMCIELEPYYCDVIIKRWEGFTGDKASLVENIL